MSSFNRLSTAKRNCAVSRGGRLASVGQRFNRLSTAKRNCASHGFRFFASAGYRFNRLSTAKRNCALEVTAKLEAKAKKRFNRLSTAKRNCAAQQIPTTSRPTQKFQSPLNGEAQLRPRRAYRHPERPRSGFNRLS